MSNTDNNLELSIAYTIRKITKAQTELATYTTILGQLYRAKEADQALASGSASAGSEQLASDPIESFENIEFNEAYAIVPEEYRRHQRAISENQRAAKEIERQGNATRIQVLSSWLE
jgi:hypothetical protein